ncbi:MaoC/PaaZ C-terminal domain-containing protein [Sphingomonas bisphenolicum]
MPIDAEKLLRFPIPSVRQRVTPRDAAFYSLSIGMGRDPGDAAQRPFVDPLAGPIAMPAMPLVLAHPGFWLGDPDSGVDPVAVLHGAQKLELLGEIPVDTEVESRTRITHLVDKGAGKAALIFTDTDVMNEAGEVFARLGRTTFIRGGGGFGGDEKGPDAPPIKSIAGEPELIVDLPTGVEQALLYRLNGDLNPFHSDPEVAARAGFDRPVLHGLCTLGVIIHALLRGRYDYRADAIGSVGLRFASPVFPGETIRTEIWNDGAFRARALERDLIVADQGWYTSKKDKP